MQTELFQNYLCTTDISGNDVLYEESKIDNYFNSWNYQKWQKFQLDINGFILNCKDWWSSRFSEDHPDLPAGDIYVFELIWEKYKDIILCRN